MPVKNVFQIFAEIILNAGVFGAKCGVPFGVLSGLCAFVQTAYHSKATTLQGSLAHGVTRGALGFFKPVVCGSVFGVAVAAWPVSIPLILGYESYSSQKLKK